MLILITGAAGYVGRHVTARALAEGHSVRATLRDPARAAELRAALRAALGAPADRLDIVALDLLSERGWADAMEGIEGVLHTASPVPIAVSASDDAVIRPAVEGTERVMRAAIRAGVGRIVVTSSIAAILGDPAKGPRDLYTEQDWTDPDHPGTRAYARAKTLAERRARAIADETPGLRLASVNPGFVFGAPLGGGVSSSLMLIDRLVRGIDPLLPRLTFPSVAVADVAEAHLRALDAVPGARILASGETLSLPQIADIVRSAVPSARPSRFVAPDWVVRAAARVSPSLAMVAGGIGRAQRTDPASCEALLGRKLVDPRAAIAETARALAG